MTLAALASVLFEIPFPRLDPVALDFPGPIDVRWYGLGYLAGFFVAYLILRRLAQRGFLRMEPDAAGDLITALVLGVILGGRIGYILFYDFADFAANPARIFRIWEGGLSFHGGLLGVIVATWWFTRRHKIPFFNLGDGLALAVPFGIFFVRVANFINGELYGRPAGPDVPWAMRFPTDPEALRALGLEGRGMRDREEALQAAYDSGAWDAVAAQVPLRHPSQLYEALTEGLLLGLILWGVYALTRKRGIRLPDGTYGGIFLLGYGVFRSFVELFRQPDAQFRDAGDPLGTVLGPLTMGQTLSALMILGGLGILVWSWRRAQGGTPARVAG
ncbi:MAG TPA: prolipoprotein diacylglyceryl transferase [Longimicrobiaceae bacterium]